MASNIFTPLRDNSLRTYDSLKLLSPNIVAFPPGLGGQPAPVRNRPNTSAAFHTIPFTIFAPYKRKRATFYSFKGEQNQLYESIDPPSFVIALPTPTSGLKTQYNVAYDPIAVGQGWGSTMQGITETDMASRVSGALTGAAAGAVIAGPMGAVIGALAGSATGTTPVIQGLWGIGQGVLETTGSSGQVLNILAAAADNPYSENAFKNVEFRDHTFSYIFMPKNIGESEQVDKIIQLFKYAMHPRKSTILGAEGFFEFPYEFQITHSVQDTTFTMLPSVITSLEVDYSGQTDSPKFFVPTAGKQYPARITLSMTFKEMVLLTRDRLDLPDTSFVTESDNGNASMWRFRF